MATVTRARIIKIGNSQGIRIPKAMLQELSLGEEVELEAQHNQLIIRAATQPRKPREGWEEQFRLMAERGDDKLIDPDMFPPTQWELEEWEW
ncbi:MAG TPA: AbrB/MazE/SpoVT family DNA-binding domain-containing protein [Chloroflexia bacterium]|nr:AbrB/MazE/SpoVT family DNA-binding domain-containing protein [Chloroflexia bacterium]